MAKTLEVEKLKAQLARLRRMQFGRSSEKLDATIAQLELLLEDLEEAARPRSAEPTAPAPARIGERRQAGRRPLPDHLPREEVVHGRLRRECRCPRCGGAMRRLGEDVTRGAGIRARRASR